MKICPFVSHMVGEDMDLLGVAGESDAESGSRSKSKNVVILGYEDTVEGAAQASPTERKKKAKHTSTPSHVLCLKDPCRFYHSKTGDCQFDMVFEMLKSPKPAPAKTAAASKGEDAVAIKRDLDKIWQFQTKSVAEMVSMISDSEKMHKKEIDNLKKTITQSIEVLQKADKTGSPGVGLDEVANNIAELSKRIDEREESFESLTTTMSDMVIRTQDAIEQIGSKSDELSKGIGVLQEEMPTEDAIRKLIDKSVEDIGTFDPPDMSETLEEMQKRIDGAMERHLQSAPDFKKIQKDIEASLKRYENSAPNMDAVVEQTMKAHKEMDLKLTKMYNDISERMASIDKRHQNSQKRLDEVVEQQQHRDSQVAEGQKPRKSETSKGNQKEAKKLNNLGVASFHNGVYEMARDQFLEAVKLNPEFAEAYNNLGLAYTELQTEDKASQAFKHAIEINPELHAAYNNLGYVFFKQGNYEQAIEMYNEALGRSSDSSSAHTNLGNAYFKLKKYEEAEAAWSKALELDPGNDRARKNLKRIREESK